ncbi:MAG: ABC transporter permease, partial [Solirubrobacterales bacterium]
VPGMAVTFALFLMGFVAAAYFREKEWKTWERLRSTPTSPPQLVAGKLIVPFALCVTQSIVLFAVGIAFLDLRIDGALWQLPLVTLAFGAALMCGGLLLAAVCRSIGELNAVASVGALLLAALGGAIVPVSTLPAAVQDVTPFVPTYWAVDGYQRVICGSGGSILAPCAELFALAVALAAIAIVRLRSSS